MYLIENNYFEVISVEKGVQMTVYIQSVEKTWNEMKTLDKKLE